MGGSIVSAGGGGSLRTDKTEVWDFFEVVDLRYHYGMLEADHKELVWTAYDEDDQVIDTFTMPK